MISLEKLKILAHTQKSPKTVGDLGKLIVAKGFKKLPKVQKIAKSGHTAPSAYLFTHQVHQIVLQLLSLINCNKKLWQTSFYFRL